MKEKDIRSKDVQDKYLALCAIDADKLLARKAEFVEVGCPACGNSGSETAFHKQGYRYALCAQCHTLYLSPRPSEVLTVEFNNQSDAAKYWASEFYPSCAEKRRNSVYRARAEYVKELEVRFGKQFESLVDIGTGYGIFLEELLKLFPGKQVLGVEPGHDLAMECRRRNLPVFEGLIADCTDHAECFDFCSCFEVLEHVFSPIDFLRETGGLLHRGGILFANTLCADGFDIQIMWEKHRNVYPPYHINIISVDGFRILFSRAGFTSIGVTTPGRLDVDIIKNQMRREEVPRFLQVLYRREDEKLLKDLQAFIAGNNLSSHAWVVAEKA